MGCNLLAPATRGISLALCRVVLAQSRLPLFATHRRPFDAAAITEQTERVHLLPLDFLDESSMVRAAGLAQAELRGDTFQNVVLSPGILHAERKLPDLDYSATLDTFRTNIIGPMFFLKHFTPLFAKDVKVMIFAARVGSITDNALGGWFSYRTSKAAVFQLVKTYDLYLRQRKGGFCIGYHPGTVRTDLSSAFIKGKDVLEVDQAAQHAWNVFQSLGKQNRGRVYDWKGEEILP